MLLAVLGLLGAAQAAGPEVWAALYDGRLMQSADRDPVAALGVYETVLTHLPEDDALRGELLFWTARAAYESGDVDHAIELLARSSAAQAPHPEARRLLARVRMEHERLGGIPYTENFDGGRGAWVRGWLRGTEDDLQVVDLDGPGGAALAWRTDVREGDADFIVLPVGDLGRSPQRMRFFVKAEEFRAHLRVLAEDADGRRWTAPVIEVGTDDWQPVDLYFREFVPAEAPAARDRFDSSRIRGVYLRDVSAFHGLQRGPNRLFFDDVDLR